MSNFDFGHDHSETNRDRSNAWKKMSEWSHSVPDRELEDLWNDDEYNDHLDKTDNRRSTIMKLFSVISGVCLSVAGLSFLAYQLAIALGFDDFSFRESVIVTLCVVFIRYADAGVMKQFR